MEGPIGIVNSFGRILNNIERLPRRSNECSHSERDSQNTSSYRIIFCDIKRLPILQLLAPSYQSIRFELSDGEYSERGNRERERRKRENFSINSAVKRSNAYMRILRSVLEALVPETSTADEATPTSQLLAPLSPACLQRKQENSDD